MNTGTYCMCVSVCIVYVFKNTKGMYSMNVCTQTYACCYIPQCNVLNRYLEGHTKSVLLIRGTYFVSVLVDIV